MAIVWIREQRRGQSLRGGGASSRTWTVTRKFLVRTDLTNHPYGFIAGAIGVTWGDAHPEFAKLKATEINVNVEDGNGLLYGVDITYNVPEIEEDKVTGIPKPAWTLSVREESIPWELYWDGAKWSPTINSAGDLIEGIQREIAIPTWTLVKCYATAQQAMTFGSSVHDKLNSVAWAGGNKGTWRATFRGMSPKEYYAPVQTKPGDPAKEHEGAEGQFVTKECWAATVEFAYDPRGWRKFIVDVGLFEKVNANGVAATSGTFRARILDSKGLPVAKPVPLKSGVAAAVGDGPFIVNGGAGWELHQSVDWTTTAGTPPANL